MGIQAEYLMIEFTKSPTGPFLLAYDKGERASFGADFEKELIDKGYAVAIQEETNQSKSGRLQSDDPAPIEGEVIPVGNNGGNGSGRRNNGSNKRRSTRD